ncbi:DUF1242 domain-containing protein [Encephalitozoon intestinalis ATCC 50506]|uniref:Protein kish n=1 Tax=Encephalitozoon intestinalis (strain ATCC 50506) TaxID=876142 RepID=W8PKG9_ENCIT|nr:DUF1242 domain-containing protein [Encephalitozoon intestinalis ATCC 50506]AHL30110.1 DUF1242 domain-containing protein [Encephalitozoon intestinalis ATCC 50506]UTX45346.1 hypothetical protein GPK93_06g08970 [Encephalitozoon intestinalis]
MSALFSIDSLFRSLVLAVCTATYLKQHFPSLVSKNKKGFYSVFHKLSVVGERLSPFVALSCAFLGFGRMISIFL